MILSAIAERLKRRSRDDSKGCLVHYRDMQPRLADRTIVGDLLNESEIGLVIGASGTAKTFFVIDLALHVAAGREWFGRQTRQAGVVYIAAEAGRGIINRVVAYKLNDPELSPDLPFAAIVSPVNLLLPGTFMDVKDAIDAAGISLPVGLVIIDTLSRAMAGGDENSSETMSTFVKNIDELKASTGAHVLIVHHLGKGASRGARGHSSLHAAVDTEISISRDAAGGSMAVVTKQRELPLSGHLAYRLHSVDLGCDQHGKAVTSCVVEPVDAPLAARPDKKNLTAAQQRALELLVDTVARHGTIPPADGHIPDSVRGSGGNSAWAGDGHRTGALRWICTAHQRAPRIR